ncbi:hypothetical protein ACOSQ4_006467 [Xanthoceras sorbifolium]
MVIDSSFANISRVILIITILLVFMSQTQTSFAIDLNPKYTVRITNGFDNNDYPLIMQCWSHDDDLVYTSTLWKTNEWHWQFHNKFLGRTHFLCNFEHGRKEKTVDVYDTDQNYLKCTLSKNCNWIVKDDAFYFYNEGEKQWMGYFLW